MSSLTQSTATGNRTGSGWQRFSQSQKNQRRIGLVVKYIVAAVALTFSLFPILYTISAAFNPSSSISAGSLIPANPTLAHFNTILNERPFWLWMANSIKLASITAIFSGLMTLLAAYAFSRFRFRGRGQLLLMILLIQVFPALLAMVALFALLMQLGTYFPALGINTHGGLILIYLGGALGINVWLMKGYMDSVPRDIDESAMVDGASDWQIFWRLIFPLVRPIMIVVMILTFFGVYADFIMVRVMLTEADKFTVMLGLQSFLGTNYGQNWGAFAAGAVLGSIAPVAIYLVLQDFIIGGLTAGAVKG
jgi:ABC-type maltose transport system permease subunit